MFRIFPEHEKKILVIFHSDGVELGHLEEYLRGHPLQTIRMQDGDSLHNVSPMDFSCVIVMGGFMGAYEQDKYPWLSEECKFIQKCVANENPFLGICLGCQLLALAEGGTVFKHKDLPDLDLGLVELALTESGITHPATSACTAYPVISWHGDTFTLPSRAVLLAKSKQFNHVFCIGKKALGVQFHPEADSEMVRNWMRLLGDREQSHIKEVQKIELNDSMLRKEALKMFHVWIEYLMGSS